MWEVNIYCPKLQVVVIHGRYISHMIFTIVLCMHLSFVMKLLPSSRALMEVSPMCMLIILAVGTLIPVQPSFHPAHVCFRAHRVSC